MKGRTKFLASLLLAVLILTLVAPAARPQTVPVRPAVSVPAQAYVNTTGAPVLFGLNLSSGSGLGVEFEFGARVVLSGGNISPGQTLNASASLWVPPSTRIALSYLGTTTAVTIAPLGSLVNYPIPGLNLMYLGVPLTLYLNLSATITGNSSVAGPGSGGGGALSWSSGGERSFPVTASTSAAPGDVLTSSLTNLHYSVALGVDAGADIPLLGHYVVHLLTLGHLGLFPGIPSTVQSEYVVPSSPHHTAAAWFAGAAGELALGGIAAVVGVTALLGVLLWRRKRCG